MKHVIARLRNYEITMVVLTLLLMLPTLSHAQVLTDSAVAARTKHIAAQLRCPVCQGLSLQESQSELAAEMRGLIKDQILSGKTDAQVIAYFEAKYGEWILLQPRAHGFNLAVYILPFVLLFGGMIVLWFAVRRWTTPLTAPPAQSSQS